MSDSVCVRAMTNFDYVPGFRGTRFRIAPILDADLDPDNPASWVWTAWISWAQPDRGNRQSCHVWSNWIGVGI